MLLARTIACSRVRVGSRSISAFTTASVRVLAPPASFAARAEKGGLQPEGVRVVVTQMLVARRNDLATRRVDQAVTLLEHGDQAFACLQKVVVAPGGDALLALHIDHAAAITLRR